VPPAVLGEELGDRPRHPQVLGCMVTLLLC
jgi:hypothetical protein